MKHTVHVPLNKISQKKQEQKLPPCWPGVNVKRYRIRDAKYPEKIIKSLHRDIRYRIVCDEGKKKVIEKHVETIQPEILSENGLLLSPWEDDFQ